MSANISTLCVLRATPVAVVIITAVTGCGLPSKGPLATSDANVVLMVDALTQAQSSMKAALADMSSQQTQTLGEIRATNSTVTTVNNDVKSLLSVAKWGTVERIIYAVIGAVVVLGLTVGWRLCRRLINGDSEA